MQQKSIRIFVRETLDADAKLIGAGGFHLTPSKRYLAQAQNMEKYLTENPALAEAVQVAMQHIAATKPERPIRALADKLMELRRQTQQPIQSQ